MRKVLLIFLLFCNLVISQVVQGIIVDENGNPVAYASVTAKNAKSIANSEVDGRFVIYSSENNESLLISAVGYETKTVHVSNAKRISLKKIIYELDEVVIIKAKKKTRIKIGKHKFAAATGIRTNKVQAKYFPYSGDINKHPFISSINFYSSSEIEGAKVNLMLKRVNADGSPGEDILEQNMIVQVKKGGRITSVNLSEQGIQLPESGIFIVLEPLKINENKFFHSAKYKGEDGTKRESKWESYEPSFGLLPSKENTTWNFINSKWVQEDLHQLENPTAFYNLFLKKYHNKYLDVAVSLTLTN